SPGGCRWSRCPHRRRTLDRASVPPGRPGRLHALGDRADYPRARRIPLGGIKRPRRPLHHRVGHLAERPDSPAVEQKRPRINPAPRTGDCPRAAPDRPDLHTSTASGDDAPGHAERRLVVRSPWQSPLLAVADSPGLTTGLPWLGYRREGQVLAPISLAGPLCLRLADVDEPGDAKLVHDNTELVAPGLLLHRHRGVPADGQLVPVAA